MTNQEFGERYKGCRFDWRPFSFGGSNDVRTGILLGCDGDGELMFQQNDHAYAYNDYHCPKQEALTLIEDIKHRSEPLPLPG
jgi:hypothetical protein